MSISEGGVMKIKLDEIKFRKDLYPRIDFNHELVEKYSQAIEWDKENKEYINPLPPIKISHNGILIDGWHRWKAHETVGVDEIEVEVIQVKDKYGEFSELEFKKLAYKWNSNHGLQLTNKEKSKFANEMILISAMDVKELARLLSVSTVSIEKWTRETAKKVKEARDEAIIQLHLKAENSMDSIAEEMNIVQSVVSEVVKTFIEKQSSLFFNESWNLKEKDPGYSKEKPFRYNIWSLQKADKETSQFGYFPETFMANLLYYHTGLFDTVYDPFAGSGTTVDVCKKCYRRYYCSDFKVPPGREEDIKQWKIQDGLPDDLNYVKPNLVFLDPPYWLQAKGKYSDSPDDLGNMSLPDFYSTIENFLKKVIAKKVNKIAIVISPTQFPNENHEFEDHIFKLHEMLIKRKYKIEMRYQLPYSTQQYKDIHVNIMKEEKKCITIVRDLVVWKR